MSFLKKIINRIVKWNLTHNFIFNSILIFTRTEKLYKNKFNPYIQFKPDLKKSTQQNAGYSDRAEINEVILKSKTDLQKAISEFCKKDDTILDIGCGPGLYLKSLGLDYNLSGTDINASMLEEAKKNCPAAKLYHGDFLNVKLNSKFDFVYCIGVLIYIPRTDIEAFFEKIYNLLQKDGILYLNYPHAISVADVLYSDITYIQYSPLRLEKWIDSKFTILKHEHAFDGRKVGLYDKTPYKSLNPDTHRTYKNSYLLIAKKK